MTIWANWAIGSRHPSANAGEAADHATNLNGVGRHVIVVIVRIW